MVFMLQRAREIEGRLASRGRGTAHGILFCVLFGFFFRAFATSGTALASESGTPLAPESGTTLDTESGTALASESLASESGTG